MKLLVHLKGYYDWVPAPKDYKLEESDVLALKAKQDAKGALLLREQIAGKTYTEVSIHESEIANCVAHFERIGAPKTEQGVVAWYLEEKVMPHHAAPADWSWVEVEKDRDLQTFLNNRFGLKVPK